MPRKLIRKSIAPPREKLRTFVAGERVRLSPLGLERCPRMGGYFGNIIGKAPGNAYYVLFDGFKTKNRLHASYLSTDEIAARET
jgi:hypothetical protein